MNDSNLIRGTSDAPWLSIIIPTLNEAQTLPSVLKPILHMRHLEVIVVDGGSNDGTVDVAQRLNARVVISPPGRSRQMNQGAKVANGSVLLFLHADTQLPDNFIKHICPTLSQPGIVAGAFRLQINSPDWKLRLVEWGVTMRSRWWQMPYGDQALFLEKAVFEAVGSFPDMPIMEDFELVRQLKRRGQIAIAPVAVYTSDRRWQQLGICRTTFVNQVMIAGYFLGIPLATLAGWYRQQGKRRSTDERTPN